MNEILKMFFGNQWKNFMNKILLKKLEMNNIKIILTQKKI